MLLDFSFIAAVCSGMKLCFTGFLIIKNFHSGQKICGDCDIWNNWPMGTCCIAGKSYPIVCDNLYGKRIWERMKVCVCVCVCVCVYLKYFVVQQKFSQCCKLCFNKTLKSFLNIFKKNIFVIVYIGKKNGYIYMYDWFTLLYTWN